MQLSRSILPDVQNKQVSVPPLAVFSLPERILQFGTGVLLRGLCDFFVDKANCQGLFNGRIAVVKSTSSGDANEFAEQDNLYTICVRGIDNGEVVNENIICAPVSRVISASRHWSDVLSTAENPDVNIVISNTTEVGLQLVKESVHQSPPSSFPAKLLAFLWRKYEVFGESSESKTIVIPTELLSGNGTILRKIIEELAMFNQLDEKFFKWLSTHVYFCNSLVDRIVTKDPGAETLAKLQEELGYNDNLLTMCEDYRLWAIEGGDFVKRQLTFAGCDPGVFVVPDIELFKSLKLHMLNGTHTLCASLAFLSGYDTVRQAMNDNTFYSFVKKLMLDEISPAIPFLIDTKEKERFGFKVLDRFSNPFLNHLWLNITLQNTSKMRNRNMPVLQEYQKRNSPIPEAMAVGFAAYILFMRPARSEAGVNFGERNGELYPIRDDHAEFFSQVWRNVDDPKNIVQEVMQNKLIWEKDLSQFASFRDAVAAHLTEMLESGVADVLNKCVTR